ERGGAEGGLSRRGRSGLTPMAIPLSNRRRWQFAAGVAFVGCVYIFLTGTEYAASVFAARAELPSLERAVRLSPGNADYRHRLARYLGAGGDDSASGPVS